MKVFYFLVFLIAFLVTACNPQVEIYTSNSFKIFEDKVVQGEFEALATSTKQIKSNYLESFNDDFSRKISFKFSINGNDNENASRVNHSFYLNPVKGKCKTPVYLFGKLNEPQAPITDTAELQFGDTFNVTFKVDMNEVFTAFEKQGFYNTNTGEKIKKDDFRFISIAGQGSYLEWAFEGEHTEDSLKLNDDNNDYIYEITIPFEKKAARKFENGFFTWDLSQNISQLPQYISDNTLIAALYNLSLEETLQNIRDDSTFMAGEKWNGVWTRDISYSIILSLAAILPEVSKKSLLAKVNKGMIIQDTGTGGSYPVSTDRMIWAIAAWEVYCVTGDIEWLNQIYPIIKKSTEHDLHNIFNADLGLIRGESSFLDWREQSYPKWMDAKDIYASYALGTNAVHYKGYHVLSEMAAILNKVNTTYKSIAAQIRNGMNHNLWMDEYGQYSQFLYGRSYLSQSKRSEALGTALSVLFDIAPNALQSKVMANLPLTNFGVPCIYPQIPDVPSYHNNGIWPFVVAYTTWASAKTKNEKAVEHGLASIYRAAALFLTNKENMVASSGSSSGTAINSNRQLWSGAGTLATIYRIFFGLNYETGGIRFKPFIPKSYAGKQVLKNIKYRKSVLNVTVEGFGNEILEFYINGKKQKDALFAANNVGKFDILIKMNNKQTADEINLCENYFTVKVPELEIVKSELLWDKVEYAAAYNIYKNGEFIVSTKQNSYKISQNNNAYAAYQVSAVDKNKVASFLSEPLEFYKESNKIELSTYTSKQQPILLTPTTNTDLFFYVDIESDGLYLMDIEYANGSGTTFSSNKCAYRTLYVNGAKSGTFVFPQRGDNEWNNWGFSNSLKIHLQPGNNQVQLRYSGLNQNMNIDINNALIKKIRLIKL